MLHALEWPQPRERPRHKLVPEPAPEVRQGLVARRSMIWCFGSAALMIAGVHLPYFVFHSRAIFSLNGGITVSSYHPRVLGGTYDNGSYLYAIFNCLIFALVLAMVIAATGMMNRPTRIAAALLAMGTTILSLLFVVASVSMSMTGTAYPAIGAGVLELGLFGALIALFKQKLVVGYERPGKSD